MTCMEFIKIDEFEFLVNETSEIKRIKCFRNSYRFKNREIANYFFVHVCLKCI